MGGKLDETQALADARWMVGNPSAWENYDDHASEVIRPLLALIERLEAERDEALKSLEAAKGRLDEIGDYSSGYTTAAGQPLGEAIAEEVSEAIGVALAAIRSRSTHA